MTLLRFFELIEGFSSELRWVSGFDKGLRSRIEWMDLRGCKTFMSLHIATSTGREFNTVASSTGLVFSSLMTLVGYGSTFLRMIGSP